MGQVNSEFWHERRVFVTGHTGFKGSWLCLWLKEMGATVKGYALQAEPDAVLYQLLNLDDKITSTIGDIRDYKKLLSEALEFKPEIIIHLAAQSLVRFSYENPLSTFDTNIMGTANLLQAARKIESLKAVVIVTSDKCYANQEWAWGYRENDPMGGHDPYSASKGCAELITSAMRHSFFNPEQFSQHGIAVASARAGNVIGGGDFSQDRLVPDLIGGFMHGHSVHIRNPEAIRPWQHVLEPISGYLKLAEDLVVNGADSASGWNFGPSIEDMCSVREISNRLVDLWGGDAQWIEDEGQHPHEASILRLDSSRAIQLLGWRPRWCLQKALERTVSWYRVYINDPSSVEKHSIVDINEYSSQ